MSTATDANGVDHWPRYMKDGRAWTSAICSCGWACLGGPRKRDLENEFKRHKLEAFAAARHDEDIRNTPIECGVSVPDTYGPRSAGSIPAGDPRDTSANSERSKPTSWQLYAASKSTLTYAEWVGSQGEYSWP